VSARRKEPPSRRANRAPLFAAIVVIVALWPFVHRGLVLSHDIDPWRLGGFAMYTTYQRTIVGFFEVTGAGLRVVQEGELPEPVREVLTRFRIRRSALGTWESPDEAVRALHAARPELEHLVVAIQRLWLDPATAHIASEKKLLPYVAGTPLDAEAPPGP